MKPYPLTSEQTARLEIVFDKLESAYNLLYDAADLITDANAYASDGRSVAVESNDDDATDFFAFAEDASGYLNDTITAVYDALEIYRRYLSPRIPNR